MIKLGKLENAYTSFLDICGKIAGVCIASITFVACLEIFIRILGFGSLPWSIEVIEYLLFATTFLAAPWVLHQGAHVSVNLVVEALSPGVRKIVGVVVESIGFMIAMYFIYYGLITTIASRDRGLMLYKNLSLSEWPFLAIIPLCGTMLAIEFVLRLWRSFAGESEAVDKSQQPDGF